MRKVDSHLKLHSNRLLKCNAKNSQRQSNQKEFNEKMINYLMHERL
jgi:hypothetical protein